MSKKKETSAELTVQDIIPIRSIHDEMIETKDNRLVKILSVSSVNKSLMSYWEEEELHNNYRNFLETLDQPLQIARVAQPIDLKKYVDELSKELRIMEENKKNPFKNHMMKGYIRYTNKLQRDRTMIRRQRYVIIQQAYHDEKSKEEAIHDLRQRTDMLLTEIEGMLHRQLLDVRELTNAELEKCIHMFIDYENAQYLDITERLDLPYQIGPRSLMEAAEQLKKDEEFL